MVVFPSLHRPPARMPHLFALLLAALLVVTGPGPGAGPAAAAVCTDADPIARHYCELGGAASFLGDPVGAPYPVGVGRAQEYERGTIYWSAASGAHEVTARYGRRSASTAGRSACWASR